MSAQASLFADIPPTSAPHDWKPQEPPSLSGVTEIALDVESTGLRWWGSPPDRPVGIALATRDGRSWYLPFRHAGGNLDERVVLRWARSELRGKRILGYNVRFDAHMMRVFGADLEELGCTLSDVGFCAALLDERRREMKLDDVARHYLGIGKIRGLNVERMRDYHAADVSDYARRDALLVTALDERLDPMIEADELCKVRALEDDVIPVVCEMERNGAPLDRAKLDEWTARSGEDFERACWELYRQVGFRVDPGRRDDIARMFRELRLQPEQVTESGKPSYRRDSIASLAHPAVATLRRARALAQLRSKFLLPYQRELRQNGRLMYSLHQLPVEDEGGTRSGRFSSSSFGTDPPEGQNIQQVSGKKHAHKMRADLGDAYQIRELFVPESGLYLKADAMQIEYRLFAHFAKPPRVLEAYRLDPRTDFHSFVMEQMLRPIKPDITRERTKDLNFAKIYGAGPTKIALMLGMRVDDIMPFVRAYDRAFPEARKLIDGASRLAETRGYVKTMLGRRSRFPDGLDLHKALNRVIQGSAADEMKIKLSELHRERWRTGLKLRFTVHDEVCGDVPDEGARSRVEEILNRQILRTRVPLLWNVGVGANWRET